MNIYSKLLSHCMTWENKFASQFFLTSVEQFNFKSQLFEFQNNLQTGSRALMFFKTLAVNQVRKKLEIIQGSVRRMVIFSCTGLWDFDILLLEKLKLTPWFFWNKMEKENNQTKPTKENTPQMCTSSLAQVFAAEPKCVCQEHDRILPEITAMSFPYLSCFCNPADKSW